MKEFVLRNFQYNAWANDAACASIETLALGAPQRERALKLLGHLLSAGALWRSRILGEDVRGRDVWPVLTLEECRTYAATEASAWSKYLAGISDADIESSIEYSNIKGDSFKNQLADILLHAANHGTYHRGQVALLVREADGKPAVTDFIAFARLHP
jgi:uncharacterized damage-inducible protein DinB